MKLKIFKGFSEVGRDQGGGYKPLTHRRLKILQLLWKDDYHTSRPLTILLRQANFPNLQQCKLSGSDTFSTETFVSFVARSSCAIAMCTLN